VSLRIKIEQANSLSPWLNIIYQMDICIDTVHEKETDLANNDSHIPLYYACVCVCVCVCE
jgi:hypothetical protein